MSDSPPSAIDEAHDAIARCMDNCHRAPEDVTAFVDELNGALAAICERHGITLDELAHRLHLALETEQIQGGLL